MRHPDEGTIHAWLDGALSGADAHALEEHVASCPACAARVAEARGMVAGASRILAALDAAPGRVVPAGSSGRRPSRQRGAWWRRPGIGIAAAMAIVAVGSTWAVTHDWTSRLGMQSEAAAPMVLGEADSLATMTPQAGPSPAEAQSPDQAAADAARAPAPPPSAASGAAGNTADRQMRIAAVDTAEPSAGAAEVERLEAVPSRARLQDRVTVTADVREEAAAKAAESEAAARGRVGALQGVLSETLRVAPAAPPAPASAERRARAAADLAPVMSGRSLGQTARDLAGCYALELGQTARGDAPVLPSIVQLAESADQAASPYTAPPAQGFRMAPAPLLVPPAMDTGQLGWRMALSDSVSVRLAADGRTVLLVFPAATDPLRFGTATAPELPGIPSWRAPVIVQRVPCPYR